MDPTVYLLVFGISISYARHTLDVNTYAVQSQINPNLSSNDQYSSQDVDRRNIDYSSNVYLNQKVYSDKKQPVYSDQRQRVDDHSYVTESDHVALISEKVDSSNNIGNGVIEFKLRTNAYPTKRLEGIEFTTVSISEKVQGSDTYIVKHNNMQSRHNDSGNANQNSEAQNTNHRTKLNSQRSHFLKNQRSLNIDPEVRFIPREIQNQHDMHVKTNLKNTTQSAPIENNSQFTIRPNGESSTIQPRSNTPKGSRGVEGNERDSKDKDEAEIPWVWGTDPGTENTTEVEDLDDRAAFAGAQCAKGFVKVMGICVEEH